MIITDPNKKTILDCVYDEDVSLVSPYDSTTHDFAGWAYKEEGKFEFAEGEKVKNLSSEDTAEVDLYALWAETTYTVEFDGNENTGGSMKEQDNLYGDKG